MVAASGARRTVGARELKTRLGRYLRAVRRGTTITITERGFAVALLSPVIQREEGVDAALAELEAQGLLSRGSGEELDRRPALTLRGESIERTIARDREDRT
jgi:prevent-host-death family protein